VPESFTWDPVASPPLRGGVLYRLRNPGFVANEHAAFALGLGRRALSSVMNIAHSKQRGVVLTPTSLQARPVFQRTIAHCDMRLRAARALVMEVFAQAWEVLYSGQIPPPSLHAQMRGVAAFATEVSADVITQVFRYAGGGEVYRTQPLQRCLRDINVAAQHYQMSDVAYETYGQFALGLADADPMR
jgi:indole-3-acetate monooxygenase